MGSWGLLLCPCGVAKLFVGPFRFSSRCRNASAAIVYLVYIRFMPAKPLGFRSIKRSLFISTLNLCGARLLKALETHFVVAFLA